MGQAVGVGGDNVGQVVLQKSQGPLPHQRAEGAGEAGRRDLGQDPPLHQVEEDVGILLDNRVALRVGQDGDDALDLELEDDLLGVDGIGREGQLQEEIARPAQGEGPPRPQLLNQVGGDVGLDAGYELHPDPAGVQLRLQIGHQRDDPPAIVARVPTHVVGRGHDGFHPIAGGHLGHGQRIV